MKKSALITCVIGIISLLAPLCVSAEQHEEEAALPPLHDVWMVLPKQGMETEFFAAIADDAALRIEGGDTRDWNVYTVVIGAHPNVVQFRYCCFDWADQDAYDVFEEDKGFNTHWNEKVAPYIDHYHRYFDRTDYENSHWPDGEGDGPYYGVTTWMLKEGAGPASSEAMKEMSQMAIKDGWTDNGSNWLWLSQIGGKPQLALVSSFANFAEMAPPEQSFFEFLSEHIGAEQAGKVFSDFGSGHSSSDYTVWVHVPELSVTLSDE